MPPSDVNTPVNRERLSTGVLSRQFDRHLADQWMPGITGTELLARVNDVIPTARRGLLKSWGDQSAAIVDAAALGLMDLRAQAPVVARRAVPPSRHRGTGGVVVPARWEVRG